MSSTNSYFGPFKQADGAVVLELGVNSSQLIHGINILVTDLLDNIVTPLAGTITGEYKPVAAVLGSPSSNGVFSAFPGVPELDLTAYPIGWYPFQMQVSAIRLTPTGLAPNLQYYVTITNND